MQKLLITLTLLCSSGTLMRGEATTILCPCVSRTGECACCCVRNNHRCCCVENFEKNGSVPPCCSCPKTNKQLRRINAPYIEISCGDLFDKVTILEIKTQHIHDTKKLMHINTELEMLQEVLNNIVEQNVSYKERILSLKDTLSSINGDLWKVEDALRDKEARQEFDAEFISLARSVYKLNDLRALVKRKISTLLESHFIEEKSHAFE